MKNKLIFSLSVFFLIGVMGLIVVIIFEKANATVSFAPVA